jgi:hypothetical protein
MRGRLRRAEVRGEVVHRLVDGRAREELFQVRYEQVVVQRIGVVQAELETGEAAVVRAEALRR